MFVHKLEFCVKFPIISGENSLYKELIIRPSDISVVSIEKLVTFWCSNKKKMHYLQ